MASYFCTNQFIICTLVLLKFACVVLSLPKFEKSSKASCFNLNEKPDVTVATYSFSNCILLRMGAYIKKSEKEYVNLGDGAVDTTSSSCGTGESKPTLRIDFECGDIGFVFNVDISNDATTVSAIVGKYMIGDIMTVFRTPLDAYFNTTDSDKNYYKCDAEQNITMHSGEELMLSDFAYELHKDSSSFIKQPQVCQLDKSWSMYIILIVLVATIALVVIGIYLFSRSRTSRLTTLNE